MAAPDPLLGAEIGRYRVVRMIGEGGMGRVYEGVHPEIGSRVALKVLATWLATDAEVSERMFAEARAVNMIHHPRIVRAIDFLRLADGRPVIVMELVEGRSMREALASRDAPLGGIVDVILQVLDVLAAAHAVGVVHRDLKPDNILISPEGHARVLDFGIAKLVHPSAELPGPRTRTGVVLGTPLYMAPEQISGGVTDGSVDLYSLGVVLFEAVTGTVPFEGATDFDVMRAHVDTPPPSARALRPDVPVELERVIDRALAKHPRDRFASAIAMGNALRVAAQALPDHAWRSLSPSAPIPARPTVPNEESALATAPVGRLGVPTANATPGARATLRDRPAPKPSTPRARWIAPLVASIGTAGVIAVVLSTHGHDEPAASPPVVLSRLVPGDAHVETPVVTRAPVDAGSSTPDASSRRAPSGPPHAAVEPHAHSNDDVFAFTDTAGFETCMRLQSLVVTTNGSDGTQTRTLGPAEIQGRCVDAAVQQLARVANADAMPYIEVVKRAGMHPVLAIDLVDLAVRRSRSACNDIKIYELLAEVLERTTSGTGRDVVRTKAVVARCLKDDAFRKDFIEELQSHDKNLAARACEILTDQKLVTSCH
jgi:serine/threonine protein kinase